jgi:hypothetical protein
MCLSAGSYWTFTSRRVSGGANTRIFEAPSRRMIHDRMCGKVVRALEGES